MASYTLEDVELIRAKSGVSYEEAISMLDYHNGETARVLADLEKKGMLKENSGIRAEEKKNGEQGNGGSRLMSFIQRMYRTRIKVQKGNTTIVNLSVLFMALAVILFSPHLAIVSLILGLILGYRITIDKDDEAFREARVETLVKNAADNVRQAVSGLSREIENAVDKKKTERKESAAPEKAAAESAEEIQVTPAPDMNAEIVSDLEKKEKGPDVPVIRVPVRSGSTDGNVEVSEDGNGYHTATIG